MLPPAAVSVAFVNKIPGAPPILFVAAYRPAPWTPKKLPPKVMFPPVDNKLDPLAKVIAPIVELETGTAVPEALALKVISPTLVCITLSAARLMAPVAWSKISAPESVDVRFWETVISPPYAVIGPAAVIAVVWCVTFAVLSNLPIVRPLIVWPFWFQLNQDVNTSCPKLVEAGWKVTEPVVAIFLVPENSNLSYWIVTLLELVGTVVDALDPK